MKEKDFLRYIGKENTDRIRFSFKTEAKRVVDLVVQYETLIDEKWVAVVRYDCSV